MFYAETPTLDGGALFVGLVILIVLFAAACVVVFGGAVLAFRAGRGSPCALKEWAVLAVVAVVAALVPDVPYGRLGTAFVFVSATLAAPRRRVRAGEGHLGAATRRRPVGLAGVETVPAQVTAGWRAVRRIDLASFAQPANSTAMGLGGAGTAGP